MAREGTHFAQCFTCQPVCGPGRARPCRPACTPNHSASSATASPSNRNTRTSGCISRKPATRPATSGKWHIGAPGEHGPVDPKYRQGYDYWLASNCLEFTSWPYETTMYDNDGQPVSLPGLPRRRAGWTRPSTISPTTRTIRSTCLFRPSSRISRTSGDNFPPPDGYRERYDGRWIPPDLMAPGSTAHKDLGGYWGQVKRLDEGFGRILDVLKSLKLTDDTIVLYTADHANHFKTRNSEYKRSCHDNSLRIPGAATGPGLHGGRVAGEHRLHLAGAQVAYPAGKAQRLRPVRAPCPVAYALHPPADEHMHGAHAGALPLPRTGRARDHSNSMITASTARLSPGAALMAETFASRSAPARFPSSSPPRWRAAGRR